MRFRQAAGSPQVASPQLGVGQPRLALEPELVETEPPGLLNERSISISHKDILARILIYGYGRGRLYEEKRRITQK
jgi:hypothetical protein